MEELESNVLVATFAGDDVLRGVVHQKGVKVELYYGAMRLSTEFYLVELQGS